jgi:thiol:disulfide interchange protein
VINALGLKIGVHAWYLALARLLVNFFDLPLVFHLQSAWVVMLPASPFFLLASSVNIA